MSLLTHRVFYNLVGAPFLRGLVLPGFAVLLAVAMLDAVVSWTALRERLALLGPGLNAVQFTGVIVAWSFVAGRALRPVWNQRAIGFLVRQPVGRWKWVAHLAPSLAVAFVPVAAIWSFAPLGVNAAVHYAAFVGLSWPIVLGASFHGPSSFALIVAGAAVLGVSVLGYLYFPPVAYAVLVLSAVVLPIGVAPIAGEISRPRATIAGHLSGAGVVATLTRRDLRCLFRGRWKHLVDPLVFSILMPLMMLAFRLNGDVSGRDALVTACVFFAVGTWTLYESLERMKVRLGKEIMRRRWPITYAQRALALLATMAILVGPCAILIAAFGSTMGAVNELLYLLFVAATMTSTGALFGVSLPKRSSAAGFYYLLLVAHVLFVMVLPAWVYVLAAGAAVGIGVPVIARCFRAFANHAEGGHLYGEPARGP